MKKIISTVVIVLSFSTLMNAQELKSNPNQTATLSKSTANEASVVASKMELLELSKIVDFNSFNSSELSKIFEVKNNTLTNPQASADRKKETVIAFVQKLKTILGDRNYEILQSKPDFYNKITNNQSTSSRK